MIYVHFSKFAIIDLKRLELFRILFLDDTGNWRFKFAKRSKKNFKFIDLFAGIGGIRLGMEDAGGKCVFSSEWDPHAQKTYKHMFGEQPSGDITKVVYDEIPQFDVLTAGFLASLSAV